MINERLRVAAMRPKAYNYLTDDNDGNKKNNMHRKKCVIKRKLKFEIYKNYLEAPQLENKYKQI